MIPKSLHTVTVLVNVARELGSLPRAVAVLGYKGVADPYGLVDKARAILAKDAR